MRISRLALLATIAVAGACSTDATTAPTISAAPGANSNRGVPNGNRSSSNDHRATNDHRGATLFPGSSRTADALAGNFVPLNCAPKQSATGSAEIGPSGGILEIGTHRLIVPAGALTKKVVISGTVPEGRPFEIDLQPHGLQFNKAAGLILDARSCTEVPTIVYLIDEYNLGPPITAFYSNWWKAIACPIWHFSGYMIALGEGSEGYEDSAQ